MATSATEICNYAIVLAKSQAIDDINSDSSEQARNCNLLYPLVRDAALRLHNWKCATQRVTLTTPDLPGPLFEYDYSFTLPEDCLRVVKLVDSEFNFLVEGGKLLTNESQPKIVYISQQTDVSKFDSLLVELIAVKLAFPLILSLQGSDAVADKLLAYHDHILNVAKQIDGKETSPKKIVQKSGWDEARLGYRGARNPYTRNR